MHCGLRVLDLDGDPSLTSISQCARKANPEHRTLHVDGFIAGALNAGGPAGAGPYFCPAPQLAQRLQSSSRRRLLGKPHRQGGNVAGAFSHGPLLVPSPRPSGAGCSSFDRRRMRLARVRRIGESIIKRPSAFIPVVMSLAALGIVLGHLAVFGTAREADEGAAAHLWQLLMAGQLPIIAFFALTALPRAPRQGLLILALQACAALAALAPVFAFKL